MNYREAEEWLFGRRRLGMKYGLDRMRSLMEDLDHPERSFKTVHVVGTNGKGSTAAILSSLAGELGFSWGRGTSPHLLDYRERIAVDNLWIPEETVAEFITDNARMLEFYSATFFEITTAMAAWYWALKNVRWVVAEAGLGGRLDATRTYNGVGTVFTGVRIEHSRILGDSEEKIAGEKIAIAQRGSVLVAGRQSDGVEKVIDDAVTRSGLRRVVPKGVEKSPLPGKHQLENSSLAYTAALELFGKSAGAVESAYGRLLGNLKWAGRLDHRSGDPSILFDVAHNPQSMEALVGYLSSWKKPVPAVVGFLEDKPWQTMVEMLRGVVGPVVVTTPDSERKLTAAELGGYMRSRGFDVEIVDEIGDAVARCRNRASGGRMIVTGSFYVVGEAINRSVKEGWVTGVPDSFSNS